MTVNPPSGTAAIGRAEVARDAAAHAELPGLEADVLALLADGRANKEIAARLYLSPRTVEKHVERLMTKTSTSRRAELAALATRLTGASDRPECWPV